jgi:hypothetical protein
MLKSQTVHWSPSLGCAFGRHPLEHRIAALALEPSIRRMVTIRLVLVFTVTLLTFQLGEIYFPPRETATPAFPQPVMPSIKPTHVRSHRAHHARVHHAVDPIAAPVESAPQTPDVDA